MPQFLFDLGDRILTILVRLARILSLTNGLNRKSHSLPITDRDQADYACKTCNCNTSMGANDFRIPGEISINQNQAVKQTANLIINLFFTFLQKIGLTVAYVIFIWCDTSRFI